MMTIENTGEPIKLTDVRLSGIAAEPGRKGQTIKVWSKLALTSDEPLFHRAAEGLIPALSSWATRAGATVDLRRADLLLLVIKPDHTAELWVDAAAVSLNLLVKRDIKAGAAVFEKDIADVVGMSFPAVQISSKDRILCLFRQDWRFALFFDLKEEGIGSLPEVEKTLGTLYRALKHRHLYEALANETVFASLIRAGWFPFVELLGHEFKELADHSAAGFDLDEVEARIVDGFDNQRVDRMLKRWLAKPALASREKLLTSATNAFKARDPIATIKIVLTEIEGVLIDAYRAANGKSAKLATLLQFAISSAEKKAGSADTLLLPTAFGRYLTEYTFCNFDPEGPPGSAGSRHAVGHGVADPASYTDVRALQCLLSFDQLVFYL